MAFQMQNSGARGSGGDGRSYTKTDYWPYPSFVIYHQKLAAEVLLLLLLLPRLSVRYNTGSPSTYHPPSHRKCPEVVQ